MTPLTVLLHSRMEENGWKLRDVCRPPDGTLRGAPARATMSQHLQPGYWLKSLPREQTREELAIAVRVSPDEILQAAIASLAANRHHISAPEGDGELVARGRHGGPVLPLDGLTDEQQSQLRQLAELFRGQNPKAQP
jgi:hypothetical protein